MFMIKQPQETEQPRKAQLFLHFQTPLCLPPYTGAYDPESRWPRDIRGPVIPCLSLCPWHISPGVSARREVGAGQTPRAAHMSDKAQ